MRRRFLTGSSLLTTGLAEALLNVEELRHRQEPAPDTKDEIHKPQRRTALIRTNHPNSPETSHEIENPVAAALS
jgi:hypothetical protein